MRGKGISAKKICVIGLLAALELALSRVERLIPLQLVVPLPGVKLGLANIVSMMALYFVGWREALAALLVRCVLGGIFGGNVTGFCMSLCGGVCAFFTMLAAKKSGLLSVYGVSILGAATHNTGQVLAASVLLRSPAVFSYLPFLLVTAVVTGTLTGAAAAAAFPSLRAAFSAQSGSP